MMPRIPGALMPIEININADTFLETCDTPLIRHALFLKENMLLTLQITRSD